MDEQRAPGQAQTGKGGPQKVEVRTERLGRIQKRCPSGQGSGSEESRGVSKDAQGLEQLSCIDRLRELGFRLDTRKKFLPQRHW